MEHVAVRSLGQDDVAGFIETADASGESGDRLVLASRPLSGDELSKLKESKLALIEGELANKHAGGISVIVAEIDAEGGGAPA